MSSSSAPQPETPLGNLLPAYAIRILVNNGIHTLEGLQRAYPHDLVKIKGIGPLRLRQIETVLYSGKPIVRSRARPPSHHVEDSSLNGTLAPATVRALARAGITKVEQLREAGPERLLRIQGLGIQKLQEIESAFFAGKMHEPQGSLEGITPPLRPAK
jgi:DNA repair protein RadC